MLWLAEVYRSVTGKEAVVVEEADEVIEVKAVADPIDPPASSLPPDAPKDDAVVAVQTSLEVEVITVYRCNPRLMKKLAPAYLRAIPAAGISPVKGDSAEALMKF